jgi:hypothetical protein
MRFRIIIAIALATFAAPAVAGEKSQVRASNGVIVDVNSDAFANRYEYSAPTIKFSEDGASDGMSFALVAAVKKANEPTKRFVTGAVYYRGDWHRYTNALFKGGDPAPFVSTSRDVLSCRYGCSFTEGFMLEITPEQITKYSQNGVLQVQLRASSSNTAIVSIPVSYFEAVAEASR